MPTLVSSHKSTLRKGVFTAFFTAAIKHERDEVREGRTCLTGMIIVVERDGCAGTGGGGGCSLRLLFTPVLRKHRDACAGSRLTFPFPRGGHEPRDDARMRRWISLPPSYLWAAAFTDALRGKSPKLILSPVKLTIKLNRQEREVKN